MRCHFFSYAGRFFLRPLFVLFGVFCQKTARFWDPYVNIKLKINTIFEFFECVLEKKRWILVAFQCDV